MGLDLNFSAASEHRQAVVVALMRRRESLETSRSARIASPGHRRSPRAWNCSQHGSRRFPFLFAYSSNLLPIESLTRLCLTGLHLEQLLHQCLLDQMFAVLKIGPRESVTVSRSSSLDSVPNAAHQWNPRTLPALVRKRGTWHGGRSDVTDFVRNLD